MSDPRKLHVIIEDVPKEKKRWISAAILIPALVAVFTSLGTFHFSSENLRQSGENLTTNLEAQRVKFEAEQSYLSAELKALQAHRERELSLAEGDIVRDVVQRLNESTDFEAQRRAIHLIASIAGVPRAVETEAYYRSGATIRALQDMARNDIGSLEDDKVIRKIIDDALAQVPMAVFIDSSHNNNVYCTASKSLGRTNIDDIYPILRDLPLRFISERVFEDQFASSDAEILIAQIIKAKPGLIVMHHGAFEGSPFDKQAGLGEETISAFLEPIFKAYEPSVVIYSRTSGFVTDAQDWFVRLGKIGPYFLKLSAFVQKDTGKSDPENNRDCFASKMPNGMRIRQAVENALVVNESYRFGLKD
ncbi:hypothetical protein [Lentilitoribacter sp. EG35]|uniref:hypothetical protein n=1 Tax=Lentilitoribacter sp. EG35 TaxID=3234192 RepID=UPI00345FFC21